MSPVTLVSDCEVQLYVMSRNDMIRRLPKRLLLALSEPACETLRLPDDQVLLERHRQHLRWTAYKQALQREVLVTKCLKTRCSQEGSEEAVFGLEKAFAAHVGTRESYGTGKRADGAG